MGIRKGHINKTDEQELETDKHQQHEGGSSRGKDVTSEKVPRMEDAVTCLLS